MSKVEGFKWGEWYEYPLDESSIGAILVPIWEKQYQGIKGAPVLECWVGEPHLWDELILQNDYLCYGFPRDTSCYSNLLMPYDYFFVVNTKKLGLGIVPLGFESEFIHPKQINYEDYDAEINKLSRDGAKTMLARYAVTLLQIYQDDLSVMLAKEEQKLAKHKLQKTRKVVREQAHWMAIRFQVLERDRFRCRYCGRDASEVKLQVDHILPKSKGGKDEMSNLVTACQECNQGKRATLLLATNKKGSILSRRNEGQIPSFMALP